MQYNFFQEVDGLDDDSSGNKETNGWSTIGQEEETFHYVQLVDADTVQHNTETNTRGDGKSPITNAEGMAKTLHQNVNTPPK